MKRYAIFRNNQYYPRRGLIDFEKSFDTLQEAQKWIMEHPEKTEQSLIIEDLEDYE